jgi:hypothetical protein
MFDLILAAIVGIAAAAVVIAWITLEEVLKWFHPYKSQIVNNPDLLAVSIKQAINNGDTNLIQGVFSRSQGQLLAAHSTQAKRLDSQLEARHRYNEVVVYAPYEF